MVIFHSYVKLPEAKSLLVCILSAYLKFLIAATVHPSSIPIPSAAIRTWEAPTLKSVSNAKPRKRIPTTNGTCDAAMWLGTLNFLQKMEGIIKIYGWFVVSTPLKNMSLLG